MELTDIATGTRLELEPEYGMDSEKKRVYVSSFECAEGRDTALITAPISEGRLIPLEKGSVYNVCFLNKAGKLIDLYKFRAVIREGMVIDNMHLLRIEKLGEIVRIQRRSFFGLE